MSSASRAATACIVSSFSNAAGPMMVELSFGSSVMMSIPGWMYWVTCLTEASPPHAISFSMWRGS